MLTVAADFSDVETGGEGELMAIVIDPGFATNRRFYTCQSNSGAGSGTQVIAWTMAAGNKAATRVNDPLVDGIPSEPSSSGCRMRFGPEGYLWIAASYANSRSAPQDLTDLGGKVLRVVASTGAGAPGNPFAAPNSPLIYTYGHRSPQGLALRPGGGRQMWVVEQGPDYGDEVNLLTSGDNYGWDPVTDDTTSSFFETAPMTDLDKYPMAIEAKWSTGNGVLDPGGVVFLEGDWWGPWEGRLAMPSLLDQTLRVLEFSPAGDALSEISVEKLRFIFGRLRTPMLGPDGALYVSTSNGSADKILRVTPQVAPRFLADTDVTQETPENAAITTIVAFVEAKDPNGGEAVTYSLGGTDASHFNIQQADAGALRANAPLDHEAKSSYQVDVIATDPNGLSSKIALTINVTDAEDAGAITLSPQPLAAGIGLTARITVPDGGVSSARWTWSKSRDKTTWTTISGATSATYRPVAADVGNYLRATAVYTDNLGSGENAQQETEATVPQNEVTVSETDLMMVEGGSATYTMVLEAQPASNVVIRVGRIAAVTVTVDTDGVAPGNQNTLTFTMSNWDRAQTVTLSAAEDDDAVVGGGVSSPTRW